MWLLDHPATNQPSSSLPSLSPLRLETVERKPVRYVSDQNPRADTPFKALLHFQISFVYRSTLLTKDREMQQCAFPESLEHLMAQPGGGAVGVSPWKSCF